MSIKTGTYTGNGGRQRIDCGFRPEIVIALPETALFAGFKMPDMWAGRSNVFGAAGSYISGCLRTAKGFAVGPADKWNADGVTYHYVALAKSASLPLAFAGSMGNMTAGRAIYLDDPTLTPIAVLGKRDSGRDGVMQIGSGATSLLGGSAVADIGAISGLTAGGFTIGASVYTNEYYPTGELGEGMDFAAFGAGAGVAVAEYSGSASARSIALGFQPAAVILGKRTGSTLIGRIKTDTMTSDQMKPVSADAIENGGVTFTSTGLDITAGSAFNVLGHEYIVLAFKAHSEAAIAAPVVHRRGRRAVLLPARGVASWINCGTDNSLVIDGAITLEWMGSIEPVARGTPAAMMWRGNAITDTSGSCSFALYAQGYTGGPGDWSGPMLCVGCSDRLSVASNSTEIRKMWRTGLIPEYGIFAHWLATHDGAGGWRLFKDGRLVRQRKIDLTSDGGYPNIDGITGHRMVFGAMHDGTNPVHFQRQRMLLGRVYNRALTASEVASRFARAGLGSAEADVTSGLVEEWDARNASGASLPATVASANNGAIVNGSVIGL